MGEWSEYSRHFRGEKEYPKDKLNELETNSSNKNTVELYRGMIELKEGLRS
jgi:hypothetical protein